jgi:hypothetical protein
MLVVTPLGELRKILQDSVRICMENMRPVAMDENASIIETIERISSDMRPSINENNTFIPNGCKPLC